MGHLIKTLSISDSSLFWHQSQPFSLQGCPIRSFTIFVPTIRDTITSTTQEQPGYSGIILTQEVVKVQQPFLITGHNPRVDSEIIIEDKKIIPLVLMITEIITMRTLNKLIRLVRTPTITQKSTH